MSIAKLQRTNSRRLSLQKDVEKDDEDNGEADLERYAPLYSPLVSTTDITSERTITKTTTLKDASVQEQDEKPTGRELTDGVEAEDNPQRPNTNSTSQMIRIVSQV